MEENYNSVLASEVLKEEKEAERLKKSYSLFSFFRLVAFLGTVTFLYMGATGRRLYLACAVYSFVAFIVFIRIHSKIDKQIKLSEIRKGIFERYIKRLTGEWRTFADDGSDFMNSADSLSYDLDLLGKNSIYQMLSVAHTESGRKRFAEAISLRTDNIADIKRRNEAVNELSAKKSFRYSFEAAVEMCSSGLKKSESLVKKSGEADAKKASGSCLWMIIPMIIVPLINIAAIVLVLLKGYNPGLVILTFMIGLAITWTPKGLLDSIILPVYIYGQAASGFSEVLMLVDKESFSSEILKGIKDRISDSKGLLQSIKQMQTLGEFVNISFNPIVHMVLAGFTGWDYYIAMAAAKWNKNNSRVFEECSEAFAIFEELISFSVLSVIRDTVKPKIAEDLSEGIEMRELTHPLLQADKAVSNSTHLTNRINVITGSNMSGKTTFMRTVAINTVLTYAGANVCGEYFKVPIMKLFTSMRVMDDVSGGISTFYAEILRIKAMAEYVESGQMPPMLCLIDEIFKGTNSADRIVGASEAIKKLSSGKCMVIVSTHDFELCDLKGADENTADNYHFEEFYENDELCFDYKIKSGKCTTRNAMQLLKMAGIVQN